MNIQFLKNHIHDGKEYSRGDTAEDIDDSIAQWLIKNRIAKPVSASEDAGTKSKGGKKRWE